MFWNCFYNCFTTKSNYNPSFNADENTNLINRNNNIILKITDGNIYKIPHPENKKDIDNLLQNFDKEINSKFDNNKIYFKINLLNNESKKNNIFVKYIFNIINIEKNDNKFIHIPSVFLNNKFSLSIYKFNKNNMILDDFTIYMNIRKISNYSDISLHDWRFLEKIFTNIGFNCELIFD